MEWFEQVIRQNLNDVRIRFLTDYERSRELALKQRTEWFEQVNLPNKKAVLFEFEMLLLGIERFFEEKGLGRGDYSHLMTKNFSTEISFLHESIRKVHFFTNRFLLASDDTLAFRQFVNHPVNLRTDQNANDPISERNAVSESLFLLNSAFKAYLSLLEGLLTNPVIPYQTFDSLGFLIHRELQSNMHFSPRHFEQFTPLYDRIHSEVVQSLIRSIKDTQVRHLTSLVLLVLFRILNYLRFIPRPCSDTALVKKSMVILSIISSEMKNLLRFLEQETAKGENGIPKDFLVVREIAKSEYERAFLQELENFSFSVDRGQRVTSSIDIIRWILTNACHECAMTCLRIFNPAIKGQEIFPDYFSPEERAVKLRRDLYLFDHMLNAMERAIRDKTSHRIAPVFRSILEFTAYFETVEFQALRLAEYRKFREFTASIWHIVEAIKEKSASKTEVEDFKRRITTFRPVLWQTIQEVNKRTEIADQPADMEEIRTIFEQYIERVRPTPQTEPRT